MGRVPPVLGCWLEREMVRGAMSRWSRSIDGEASQIRREFLGAAMKCGLLSCSLTPHHASIDHSIHASWGWHGPPVRRPLDRFSCPSSGCCGLTCPRELGGSAPPAAFCCVVGCPLPPRQPRVTLLRRRRLPVDVPCRCPKQQHRGTHAGGIDSRALGQNAAGGSDVKTEPAPPNRTMEAIGVVVGARISTCLCCFLRFWTSWTSNKQQEASGNNK
jgi:hypothetical protein